MKSNMISTGIFWSVACSFLTFPLGVLICSFWQPGSPRENILEVLGVCVLLVVPLLLIGGIVPIAAIGAAAGQLSKRKCISNPKRASLCCVGLAFLGDLVFVLLVLASGILKGLFYMP